MDIFFEIHSELPREAPGNDEATAKALSLVPKLPKNPIILDIGCGPGMQTLALARITGGQVIAVDTHQPFLDELQRRAEEQNLSSQIRTQNCSMLALDFKQDSFDLIWSEGAIYIMGFREGLQSWYRFLKPEGSVAVSELSWLVKNPPEEPLEFFKKEYPSMKHIEDNISIIKQLEYSYINSFILPEAAWWDNYYIPLERRISKLRKKYQNNPQAHNIIEEHQTEIEIYRNYYQYYGYVFYLMQKESKITE
ncbi:MAG: class I SAM-dependent methyltransferase [Symploca sp. SIO3C6]|uniref:Class I SAM-dependent methyltransferase n=1 Tax=Symploca sp. SIO1C4 TaxID=2607765 RepID=A0A6B3NJQ6_9CYAN|nr:class I SAM-dependent methyltransferase [Symploca sp. SIO3C6]NER31095.1 class I SAM-dependent methyltransferase [Symploca sp. SIO1C4]NET06725.1 class I SAM-dependent methyltransferase [Symploca sp. SIO2B6]NET49895.1 class I SAM-dependent methyltransferase [Merismopedia sp. SIO2A8]